MKKSQRRPSKSLILRLCVLAFAIYAAVTLVDMQVEIQTRKQMLDDMRKTVEVQRLANKELARQLAEGMNEEQIERIAREQLDFVYPDQKVFIDISGS